MIIVEDYYNEESDVFKRTYSDKGFMIRQDSTGIIYAEAIDPYDSDRTYTETDIPLEQEEESNIPTDQTELEEIAKILLGEL